MALHILKLCVGVDSVAELRALQERRRAQARAGGAEAELRHRTRNRPRRAAEILDGGSIYWIIKGFVQVRQRIVEIERLEEEDSTKGCAFVFAPELIRTELQPRRPHQGWRYLMPEDAPPDLPEGRDCPEDMPPEMAAELRALGLL